MLNCLRLSGQVLFGALLLAFGWQWALTILFILLIPVGVIGALLGLLFPEPPRR